MFAVIVAGRLVQTDINVIDETKFMFSLSDMDNVNHIVVFMTGQQSFQEGRGGSVYISLPSESGDSAWQLIGHLTNEKPSAIFKLSGLKKGASSTSNVFAVMNASTVHPHQVKLGISVESLSDIKEQVPAVEPNVAEQSSTFVEFTNTMLINFYNFSSSFSKSLEDIVSIASSCEQSVAKTQFIPTSVLENWMKQFQVKLARDVYFWRK